MNSKILIHACCAPCLCYLYKILQNDYDLAIYWFNPNIHPFNEFEMRMNTLFKFQVKTDVKVIYEEKYNITDWLIFTKKAWVNENKILRCQLCYKLRMEKTSQKAVELKIKNFTTTLLYSKFQQHEYIRDLGFEIAKKYNLNFIYRDFRVGWKEGITISHQLGLYRQKYCGCVFSEIERNSVTTKTKVNS